MADLLDAAQDIYAHLEPLAALKENPDLFAQLRALELLHRPSGR